MPNIFVFLLTYLTVKFYHISFPMHINITFRKDNHLIMT